MDVVCLWAALDIGRSPCLGSGPVWGASTFPIGPLSDKVISPLPLEDNTDIGYITDMAVNPETTVRKLVSLPKPMVEAILDFRFTHRIGTESEAIRRLIELGLEAAKKAPESDT